MTPLSLLLLAITVLLVGLIWRFSSRRSSLPCPTWLAWMVELDNPFARDHNARSIVARLGVQPGMRVLDAGCGPGRLTVPLAQAVGDAGQVVALDLQPDMLRRAKEKVDAAGLSNVEFIQHALGSGSLGHDRFDRAVLVTVLGEIPDRRAALSEIFRAMTPGGILSITEIIFDPHYQRRETVRQLAQEAGFREVRFVGSRVAYTMHVQKEGVL